MVRRITKLSAMSANALLELRSQVEGQLAQRRVDLEKELSRLATTTSLSRGSARRRGSPKGIKVKPKYRGPGGETWAGRGLRPGWLVALVKQGHKPEEFANGRQAASRKKVATKKSRRKRPNRKRS
jgi:DNA-binding protein H-NS